jgi:hypothetical protein
VSFALDPLYVTENCEIVYFLQDDDSREVFQAGAVELMDLVGPARVPAVAARLTLGKNYPNPFNPSTTIPVTLAKDSLVRLEVYSANGHRVGILHAGKLPAGEHTFHWNGRNQRGEEAPSDVYLVRVSDDGGLSATRPIVLLK